MAERSLVIVKRLGNTPVLGMCDICHIKFFTPRELSYRPAQAEEHLQEQFNRHECKREGQVRVKPIRKV